MTVGSPAANLGASSEIPFVPLGNGSVPTQQLGIGYGTVTLNGATPVTVADANVTASSVIVFSLTTVGGTVGVFPHIATITPGTGFMILGTASDTSVYSYLRFG